MRPRRIVHRGAKKFLPILSVALVASVCRAGRGIEDGRAGSWASAAYKASPPNSLSERDPPISSSLAVLENRLRGVPLLTDAQPRGKWDQFLPGRSNQRGNVSSQQRVYNRTRVEGLFIRGIRRCGRP